MTDSTLETVLRRDRWVVGGAIGIIVALAWSYVLWLANDMDMGGMDMTGLRMIPSGMAASFWRAAATPSSIRWSRESPTKQAGFWMWLVD